ncbi:hypothetical protein WA556_001117 [Blastocystis sp. ATCC 50177/Nand II]
MSSIWDLIKKGKEKLEKKESHATDVENDDVLMLDAEKTNEKGRKKEKKPLPSPITEYTLPEWLTKSELYDIRKLRDYPIFELHEELVYLEKWLEPTNFDKFIRQKVIEDVTAVIKKALPESEVYPFGSYLTNLCLPNSDLDLMVTCYESKKYLKIVENAIKRSGIGMRVVVISHARVPLVKFQHVRTHINVDISFNQASSLLTSAYVIRQLDRYTHLRSMVVILKYFLVQRELNDTYQGGIGSFLATLLCLSCEQWCIREGTERGNLGNRLLQFFYYYGMLLNFDKLVLRVRNDGGYVEKVEKGWLERDREFYLSVENPIDPSLDVGKSSYNIKRFRAFCSHALCKLVYNLDDAAAINRSPEGFFLQGLVRAEPRYSEDIRSSDFYAQWTKPGVVLPDAETTRLEFVKRHLEVVKQCNEADLRRVYELDYNKVMKIQKPKGRSGGAGGYGKQGGAGGYGKQSNASNAGSYGKQSNDGNAGNRQFSQKRDFEGRLGKNKKYRRF